MKIIKVLVDELPKRCEDCDKRTAFGYFCGITGKAVPSNCNRRPLDCPLALENDNKQVDAEVM